MGYGVNETQEAEWFGPDCSLREYLYSVNNLPEIPSSQLIIIPRCNQHAQATARLEMILQRHSMKQIVHIDDNLSITRGEMGSTELSGTCVMWIVLVVAHVTTRLGHVRALIGFMAPTVRHRRHIM